SPDKIELVRKGLWKVVNEDGGTGGRARLKEWMVAGKTGTAQATERGDGENVAWFTCFAPYDHPKYVGAVMVQGASGAGGEVAGRSPRVFSNARSRRMKASSICMWPGLHPPITPIRSN